MEQTKSGRMPGLLALFAGIVLCAALYAAPGLAFADDASAAAEGQQPAAVAGQVEANSADAPEAQKQADALTGEGAAQAQTGAAASQEGASADQQASGSAGESQQSGDAAEAAKNEGAASENPEQAASADAANAGTSASSENAASNEANASQNETAAKTQQSAEVKAAAASTATTSKATTTAAVASPAATTPSISYRAHMSNIGWMSTVKGAKTAGSLNSDEQMEALRVKLNNADGSVVYSVYVKGQGWTTAVKDNATAGTTGKSLLIHGVKAKLTGNIANDYDLYYRVYLADLGWMDWAKNYAADGTSFNTCIEGVQFKLVNKTATKPTSSNTVVQGVTYVTAPTVSVQAHVANKGWLTAVGSKKTAGTTGKGLQLEALKISVAKSGISGGATYSAHVANKGWLSYVSNNKVGGTTGKGLQMEGLKVDLTSTMNKLYDVYYRAHVANYGWLDWASEKELAGSVGRSLQMEAVQVYVTVKGGLAPGDTTRPSVSSYFYLDSGHGWSGAYGYDSGAQGAGYSEAAETTELVSKIAYYAKNTYGLCVFDNSDVDKNFTDRQDDAYARGCTAFISIHFNAGGGSGTETYASASEGASGSKTLQSIVHDELTSATGLTDRGAKDYDYSVLCGNVPSVLCEICFIDNSYDMSMYKAREDNIAKAIARAMYTASKQGF